MNEIKSNSIPKSNAVQPNVVELPKFWNYRLIGNLAVLLLIFVIALTALTVSNNLIGKKIEKLRQDFYELTLQWGFGVDELVAFGRHRTSQEDLLKAADVKRGDNILSLDLEAIRNRVEKLPWIRRAVVKRSYFPNVIQIAVQERRVRAIWQIDEHFYPIDDEGNVINAAFRPDRPLLLIVGEGAPEHLTALLESIRQNESILERVKVANFISQRRWNLILDDIKDGITIKLPEENVSGAWKKLLKLNSTKGILKRKLTIIDLRLKNKIVVKLKKTAPEPKKKILRERQT